MIRKLLQRTRVRDQLALFVVTMGLTAPVLAGLTAQSIPEPGTMSLLSLGAIALAITIRKRK